ncbi:interleukin-37-like [Microtus oregoni]|uniref:interleukin-37-like n=1 Tax=Microtus oregoni TaxID=111838 RepID=UPI001BB16BC0|nr:interleukin-37-like [Microtus oregoni]
MASSPSCSDVKMSPTCHKDQDEPHTETKAKCPLLSDPNPVATISNHAGPSIKPSSPYKHFIRDPNHQILVLEGGTLVAVPDKCGRRGEIFYVSALPMRTLRSAKANRISLAVCKGKRFLCCKKSKCPSLELKKMRDLTNLSSKKILPFTFLKEKAGSFYTLESAANRGYFICTCSTPRQPVGVTKELGKQKNTHFEFISANVDVREFED